MINLIIGKTIPNYVRLLKIIYFFVPASPISRPTPRLLEASRDICQKLDIARGR